MESVATPLAGSTPRQWRLPWLRLPLPHRSRPTRNDHPEMTLTGHLMEPRNRLFIAAFSLLPGSIVGFIFSDRIIQILKAPLPTKEPRG
jgi:hypothetical protein